MSKAKEIKRRFSRRKRESTGLIVKHMINLKEVLKCERANRIGQKRRKLKSKQHAGSSLISRDPFFF